MKRVEMLLGNEAMGRGLLEAGCQFVTSYPGTPSSEILPAVLRYKKAENLNIYAHWAVNEKVAFDEALAASYTGKRAAVIMKQVGLNVAADSLMSAAYTGVRGGFVIISADDPGPHSSQTEQDSRLFALFAKIPAFDPSTPLEAMEMIAQAFTLSEKHEIPVLLRPSLRVCHQRMQVPLAALPEEFARQARFRKDPERWAATPRHRYQLHRRLNENLLHIEREFEQMAALNYVVPGEAATLGIIVAGPPFPVIQDILNEFGLAGKVPILKIGTPHPLPRRMVAAFVDAHEHILVLEEPDTAIELQLQDRSKIHGRFDGSIPAAGELTPEVLHDVCATLLPDFPEPGIMQDWLEGIRRDVATLNLLPRRPSLCPGCGHRPTFFAIKKAIPNGIFTSDIGCYTLGINLKAVDTVLDMGAGLTLANGMYHAYRQDGKNPPIIATMGDSTFFHSGVPALIDGVYSGARYIFVLLDNGTTAMTGMQPTPALGVLADGSRGNRIDFARLLEGCGIKFVRTLDPYDIQAMLAMLAEAKEHTVKDDGGIAVIIAKHDCVIGYRDQATHVDGRVDIDERCNGCVLCIKRFECPAFVFHEDTKLVSIDRMICTDCGACIQMCPKEAIVVED